MYSRRKVLQSLGLAAAGLVLPTRAFAQLCDAGQTTGSAANRVQLIDADFALTKYVEKIKTTGVRTVARYYDREYGSGIGEKCWHSPTKTLTKDELQAIEDAGLSVITIFQHCNADCMNFDVTNSATGDKGRKDATAAIQLADKLGQPADTPIYFGLDFDPAQDSSCKLSTEKIWLSIETYFSQINEVLAKTHWQIGIYGCGRTIQFLKDRKLAKYFWLSASMGHQETPEFFNRCEWHIFQNRIDIQKDYARKGDEFIDTNLVNPSILDADLDAPYFGQWTTKGRAEPHDVGESFDILASRAFLKRACGYRKDADGKLLPKASKVLFDSTCRVLNEEQDGYVGISVTEGDDLEGFVHQSDIVVGGLWRNMPKLDLSKVCGPPRPPKPTVPAMSTL
jgi:Domain of unknown function (DUF1906)